MNIMRNLFKKVPFFENDYKKDIKLGRQLLFIQGICIAIFGITDAIENFYLGSYHIVFGTIALVLIYLSYWYFMSYDHRKTLPTLNLTFSVTLVLLAIINTYEMVSVLVIGGSISNSEFDTTIYHVFVIMTSFLLLFGLFTYNKFLPYYKSKLPAYYRYISIQNIRIKKEKEYQKYFYKH